MKCMNVSCVFDRSVGEFCCVCSVHMFVQHVCVWSMLVWYDMHRYLIVWCLCGCVLVVC